MLWSDQIEGELGMEWEKKRWNITWIIVINVIVKCKNYVIKMLSCINELKVKSLFVVKK